MKLKAIATAGIVAALSVAPADPVRADAGDAIAGAIIGGIIGNAIAKDQQKRKQQQTRSTRSTKSSGISSAQREANREVQVALNYFGYPVGTPDGAIGPKSRAAISQYQALLGYPATGQLSQYERDLLVNGYYRAQSGGATTAQQIAGNALGVQGLLLMYRDEQLGIRTASPSGKYGGLPAEVAASVDEIALNSDPTGTQLVQKAGFIQLADMNRDGRTDYLLDTSVTGSAFWCNATACAVRVFVSTPEGYRRNDFQAFNVTPAMFDCQRGDCTLTGASGQGTVMAAAPPAPAPAAPGTLLAAGTLPNLPVASAQPVVSGAAPTAQPGLPTFLDTGPTAVSLASHCIQISLMTNTNGGYTSAAAMTDAGFALGEQFCLARTYAMATGEELAGKVPGFTPQQISQQCQAFGPVLKDHVSALSLKPRDEVLQGVQGFILASGMAPAQLAGTAKICLGVGYASDAMDVAIGSALLLTVLGEKPYGELLGHHLSQGFGASVRPDLALEWYETGLEGMQAGGNVFAPNLPDRTELIRKAAYTISGRVDLLPPATLPVFATLAPAPMEQAAAAPVVLPEPVAASGGAPAAAGQVLSMAAKLPFLLIGQ